MHGDLEGSFVALTGGEGRLQAAVGFGATRRLLPFRKLLVAGAAWEDALAAAG